MSLNGLGHCISKPVVMRHMGGGTRRSVSSDGYKCIIDDCSWSIPVINHGKSVCDKSSELLI